MSLRHVKIPVVLNTSEDDLIRDLFIPLLKESCYYARGVGYFTSGWLRMAADGLAALVGNNGVARWITSPILEASDWAAMEKGGLARQTEILHKSLSKSIDEIQRNLKEDTLNAMSWMIAEGLLEFRLALPRGKLQGGDFHDKFGYFRDSLGDVIAFSGSYNETVHGTRNYESMKLFPSWVDFAATIAESEVSRFERLWNNDDPNLRVFEIPEAIRERILQLRTSAYPPYRNQPDKPSEKITKAVILRDYQEAAITAWFKNNCIGILEMATGSGKTKTALAARTRLHAKEGRLFTLITAPYVHLAEQWSNELIEGGENPILCFGASTNWERTLNEAIVEYNVGALKAVTVICTHNALCRPKMQKALKRLGKGASLIIADEVHHLGTELGSIGLPANIQARLGLSATPQRWMDDLGTQRISDYFGPSVYEFTLAEAIRRKYLCSYEYHPHLVELTDNELESYLVLTKKIQSLFARSKTSSGNFQELIQRLLEKRADILSHAENKVLAVSRMLEERADLRHTLFYCAEGGSQLKDVLLLLGKQDILAARFTQEVPLDKRGALLSEFSKGRLHALVAMRCLDEGVDIPATKEAYILASSTNPIQYIQRRGRILRPSEGKDFAIIHDFIAVPTAAPHRMKLTTDQFNLERRLLSGELRRFNQFAGCATNYFDAISTIKAIAMSYNLLDSLGAD